MSQETQETVLLNITAQSTKTWSSYKKQLVNLRSSGPCHQSFKEVRTYQPSNLKHTNFISSCKYLLKLLITSYEPLVFRVLEIVFLNVGPNVFEGLGTGNLGKANEGLHLGGDFPGLHDTANFGAGGWLRDGGRSKHRSEWRNPERGRCCGKRIP